MQDFPSSPISNRVKRRISSKNNRASTSSNAFINLKLKIEEIKCQIVNEETLCEVYSKFFNSGLSYTFRRSKKTLLKSSEDSILILPATDFSTPPRQAPLAEVKIERIDGEHVIKLLHLPDRTVIMSLVPEFRALEDAYRIYRNGKIVARIHRICINRDETSLEKYFEFGLFVTRQEYPTLTRSTSFGGSQPLKSSRRHEVSFDRRNSPTISTVHKHPRKSNARSRLVRTLFGGWKGKKDTPLLGSEAVDEACDSDFDVCGYVTEGLKKSKATTKSIELKIGQHSLDRIALRTQIERPRKSTDIPSISFCTLKPNGDKGDVIAKFGKGFGTYLTRNEHRLMFFDEPLADPLCLLLLSLHVGSKCNIRI